MPAHADALAQAYLIAIAARLRERSRMTEKLCDDAASRVSALDEWTRRGRLNSHIPSLLCQTSVSGRARKKM